MPIAMDKTDWDSVVRNPAHTGYRGKSPYRHSCFTAGFTAGYFAATRAAIQEVICSTNRRRRTREFI